MALDGFSQRTMTNRAMHAELLDAPTEYALARAWRDHRDKAALHRLTGAYMRLAISVAGRFRRYGAPMNDLIQEASVGLMKAAEKFDPDRGVRFSTYAVWWIRASVQDYVMRNHSMVRTGSTASQKSLFFNLRRVQARLERAAGAHGHSLTRAQICTMIAAEVGVPLNDVQMMQGRLAGGDFSLNAVQSGEQEGREWIDTLRDEAAQAADIVQAARDRAVLRRWLAAAMARLSAREQFIVRERKVRAPARTLESLGAELGLSKERVRQLEGAALGKMRTSLATHDRELLDFLA